MSDETGAPPAPQPQTIVTKVSNIVPRGTTISEYHGHDATGNPVRTQIPFAILPAGVSVPTSGGNKWKMIVTFIPPDAPEQSAPPAEN